MRIVSLLASGTEIVCALGAGGQLAGRSHECDNPPWVKALPLCSSPAFDISVSSREIDSEVRRRIRSGEPLYHIDTDRIRSLAPDLLIIQVHCDVCAVTPGDVERSGAIPVRQVLALSAGSLEGIWQGIRSVAGALGMEERGEALVRSEQGRLDALRHRTAGLPRRSVTMLEWTDPLFTMGNWGPELVQAAGGDPVLSHPGQYSGPVGFDQLREADPEFLVIAPCGFDLARAWREREVLEACPGWHELRAVRGRRVAIADGNLYFNRSGMTVTRTAEIIGDILHGGAPDGEIWRWMYE